MKITGKLLLNQAESILKDKKQESSAARDKIRGEESSVQASDGLKQGAIESRILHLQSSLGKLQREFSREQSRKAYLQDNPGAINERIVFDDKPLFPELAQGQSPDSIAKHVDTRITDLSRNLKSIQVEMENLMALTFKEPASISGNVTAQELDRSFKEMRPDRVARLTEN